MRRKDHAAIWTFAAANPTMTYKAIAIHFGVALITVKRACINLRRVSKVYVG